MSDFREYPRITDDGARLFNRESNLDGNISFDKRPDGTRPIIREFTSVQDAWNYIERIHLLGETYARKAISNGIDSIEYDVGFRKPIIQGVTFNENVQQYVRSGIGKEHVNIDVYSDGDYSITSMRASFVKSKSDIEFDKSDDLGTSVIDSVDDRNTKKSPIDSVYKDMLMERALASFDFMHDFMEDSDDYQFGNDR